MFAQSYEENELIYSNFCESEIDLKGNIPYFFQDLQDYFNKENCFNEEEEDLKENQNTEHYYFLFKKSENKNNILEKEKNLIYFKSNKNKEESKENEVPIYYSINNISEILSYNKFQNIRTKILANKNLEIIPNEIEFSKEKKKKFRNEDKQFCILIKNKDEENKLKTKRGRKANNMNNKEHGKMSPDNIIKKIKAKLFKYLIDSINNLINKKECILLKLDYRFIDKLNREQDLKYLKMTLKDLLSKDISPKYFPISKKDYNRKKIDYILKYEEDITIKFVFNLTFGDWFDIFTLKKSVKQIVDKYFYLEQDIDCEKIEQSFNGIEKLLNKISAKSSEEYFTLFVFYLYNYERWFYIKQGRNRKQNQNK